MRYLLCAILSGLVVLSLPALLPDFVVIAVCCAAVVAGVAGRARVLAVGLLFGCFVHVHVDRQLEGSLAASRTLEVMCTGEIEGLPANRPGRVRFLFRVSVCDQAEAKVPPGVLARISWYRFDRELVPGDRWRLPLRLKAPRGNRNAVGFNYETWLFVRGIGALGSVGRHGQAQQIGRAERSVHRWRWQVRSDLRARTAGLAHSGIIEALVVGSRDRMPPEQRALLGATGTAHLVAISGLHIGMVSAAGYALAGLLWVLAHRCGCRVTVSRRLFAAGVGVLSAAGYAALAGFSLPTVRALVMLVTAYCVLVSRYRMHPWLVFCVAASVVLVLWPMSLVDAGFWLSFLAVAVITIGLRARRHWSALQQTLWVNAVIGLVLAPVTVFVFGEIHWTSPVANVLLVPLFGVLIVPTALCASLLMSIWPRAAEMAFAAVDAVIGLLLRLLESVLAVLPLGLPVEVGMVALLAIGVASAIVLSPRSWPLVPLVGVAACITAFSTAPARPPVGHLRVTVLDVGHGLSVVLETANYTAVYDTGPRYGSFDTGRALVVPTVRAGGSDRIDAVVVSHADNDHAGGLYGILDVLPVARVLRPEDGSCRAGVQWHWDGIDFSILHPTAQDVGSENDRSCVLRVEVPGGQSLVLLGDVERRGERSLLQRALQPATVMTVPHHGSNTSSSAALLQALAPRLAINSHALFGRFTLPHPAVRARYQQLGIPLVGTAEAGAIRFSLPLAGDPEQAIVRLRTHKRRMWLK